MADKSSSLRLVLDVGAALIAVAALFVSVSANNKSADVAEENLRLARQTAQADAGVDAALVDFSDHADRLYVRNASRRPMTHVSLVRTTVEGENATSRRYKTLGKVELPDLLSCRDVEFEVPRGLRTPPLEEATDDTPAPFWVIFWTDAAGQRWEKVSTPSDVDGDGTDLSFLYKSEEAPPFPANDARLDTAAVPNHLNGVTQVRAWPIGNSGQCK